MEAQSPSRWPAREVPVRHSYMEPCALASLPMYVLRRFTRVQLSAPLSVGFSRQECWSGLPSPPPGDLPDPGNKPSSPVSLALQADSLPLSHQGKPHMLLACLHAKSFQSCPILCNSKDCSLPGSPVHGILQRRILEWVAIPSSRGSS